VYAKEKEIEQKMYEKSGGRGDFCVSSTGEKSPRVMKDSLECKLQTEKWRNNNGALKTTQRMK
jgi:hypothetical protein